jgi:hypothetical protein
VTFLTRPFADHNGGDGAARQAGSAGQKDSSRSKKLR